MNDFGEDLKFSKDHRNEDFWQAVYRKAFPDMEFAEAAITKGQGQYLGIDRVVYLTSGKILYIDEKLRREDHSDIFLEYISNDNTNSPGWIEKDLHIDYIAYAFLPSRRCYLFDWLMLRRAWSHYKEAWLASYKVPPAPNEGYNTLGVAVPIKVLTNAITLACFIQV